MRPKLPYPQRSPKSAGFSHRESSCLIRERRIISAVSHQSYNLTVARTKSCLVATTLQLDSAALQSFDACRTLFCSGTVTLQRPCHVRVIPPGMRYNLQKHWLTTVIRAPEEVRTRKQSCRRSSLSSSWHGDAISSDGGHGVHS